MRDLERASRRVGLSIKMGEDICMLNACVKFLRLAVTPQSQSLGFSISRVDHYSAGVPRALIVTSMR